MTAETTAYATATLPVTINSIGAAPVGLKLNGLTSVLTNSCNPYFVMVVDTYGFAQNISSSATVNLAINGGGAIYSDSACSVSAAAVTINSGTSSQIFYYKSTLVVSSIISATSTNLSQGVYALQAISPTSQTGGSTLAPLTPIQLSLSGASSILTNQCSGPFTLTIKDSNGTESPVASSKTITISGGSVTALIYSDAACASSIGTMSFSSGESNKQFYLKDTQSESITVQASEPTLVSGSMNITALQAALLSISGGPLGAWQAFYYNGTGAITDTILVVTNVGQTQAMNLQPTGVMNNGFSYKGGSFPGQGGSCTAGSNLAPGGKCTLVVRFQPSSATNFSSSLQLQFNDGVQNKISSMALSGQGNSNLSVKQVATGGNHTCFLYSDMTVKCFGNNANGELGIGHIQNIGQAIGSTDFSQTTPIISNAVQLVAGSSHNCALTSSGDVYCWGSNTYGQLGIGSTNTVGHNGTTVTAPYTKVSLGAGRTAVQISAGAFHNCALLDNGDIKCWGNNTYGQLGYEDTTNRGTSPAQLGDSLLPINLGTGLTPIVIAADGYHSCAIFNSGAIKCWGYNSYGQLGLGDASNRGDLPGTMGGNLPTSNIGGVKVQSLALGLYHICAIVAVPGQINNAMKCWGRNNSGQLGLGDTTNRGTGVIQLGSNLPLIPLASSLNPIYVSAANTHTCMMADAGYIFCWGGNGSGQLGNDSTNTLNNAANSTGVFLSSTSTGLGIAVGGNHSCAILQNSVVKCWGDNTYGQLAIRMGSTKAPNWGTGSSRAMATLPETKAATFGYLVDMVLTANQTCAVWKSGDISCWGQTQGNSYAYGGSSVASSSLSFNELTSKAFFVDSNQSNDMCFLSGDKTLKCWGNNGGIWYPLSSGPAYARSPHSFVLPNNKTPKKSITVGWGSAGTCFLTTDGTVYCGGFYDRGSWGGYWFSDLLSGCGGGNTYCYNYSSWGTLNLPGTIVDIDFSYATGCAVQSTGDVICWGYNNYGEAGSGNTSIITTGVGANISYNTITAATLGANATQIVMGTQHTCVLLDSGNVKCWGSNGQGQLGQGNTTPFYTPQAVDLNGSVITQITAGPYSTCALTNAGAVKCWGFNNYGQLGLGDTNARGDTANEMGVNLPTVQFPSGFKATKVFTGKGVVNHVCATGYLNDNPFLTRNYCWGSNQSYQLGNGTAQNNRGDGANEMGWVMPSFHNTTPLLNDPNTTDYRGPGNYTYTVPDGVNQIYVQAWGPGAAGGTYNGSTLNGGQGGAGSYAAKLYNVSPGQTFSAAVGVGLRDSYSGYGSVGQNAVVGNTYFAAMTAGGGKSVAYNDSSGKPGGSATGGDTNISGEDGSTGSANTGGSSPLGGLGGFVQQFFGNGISDGFGLAGEFPGGAGGSCNNGTNFNCYNGGSGADGRLMVTAVSNFLTAGSSGGAGVADYTNPGVYIYKIPVGVFSARVQVWGAGGGGGYAYHSSWGCTYPTGGGAGAYSDYIFNVTPGESLYVFVGVGGAGGVSQLGGSNGQQSSVGYNTISIVANGGGGGVGFGDSGGCTGGKCVGGTATGGYLNMPGGAGLHYTSTGKGGDAYLGGLGGIATSAVAINGQFPGGGGSTLNSVIGCANVNGGNGANGRVTVTPL